MVILFKGKKHGNINYQFLWGSCKKEALEMNYNDNYEYDLVPTHDYEEYWLDENKYEALPWEDTRLRVFYIC